MLLLGGGLDPLAAGMLLLGGGNGCPETYPPPWERWSPALGWGVIADWCLVLAAPGFLAAAYSLLARCARASGPEVCALFGLLRLALARAPLSGPVVAPSSFLLAVSPRPSDRN